jgi:hypothetical protein
MSSVILCINCWCFRNLSADVTRFLPTALRVKREDKKKKEAKNSTLSGELIHIYIYIYIYVCVCVCLCGKVVKVKLFLCPALHHRDMQLVEVKQ